MCMWAGVQALPSGISFCGVELWILLEAKVKMSLNLRGAADKKIRHAKRLRGWVVHGVSAVVGHRPGGLENVRQLFAW